MAKHQRRLVKQRNCPLCDSPLVEKGADIFIADVFRDWINLHRFSPEVIQEHVEQSPTTRLYECPNCSLEVFLPRVIGRESFYRELQEDTRFAYYREDKWDFAEALKDIGGCDSIMEIGCGPGAFLASAKSHIRDARGTEYNQRALASARGKGLTVYGAEYDTQALAASFDAVFSFHVLEHVVDPLGFINEMLALAKPDGKICISVPNQDGPLRYLGNSVMNMPPHHASRWRLKTFNVLAEKLNLRILKVAYEPLLLENHNYYSYYWLNTIISGKTGFHRKLKGMISLLMRKFFDLLKRLGFKHFTLLRGQAIYVVMNKKAG